MLCRETSGPKPSSTLRSPVDHAPFTNCATPTRSRCPNMRSASPKAVVDLPLPGRCEPAQALLDRLARDLRVLDLLPPGHLLGMARLVVIAHFTLIGSPATINSTEVARS